MVKLFANLSIIFFAYSLLCHCGGGTEIIGERLVTNAESNVSPQEEIPQCDSGVSEEALNSENGETLPPAEVIPVDNSSDQNEVVFKLSTDNSEQLPKGKITITFKDTSSGDTITHCFYTDSELKDTNKACDYLSDNSFSLVLKYGSYNCKIELASDGKITFKGNIDSLVVNKNEKQKISITLEPNYEEDLNNLVTNAKEVFENISFKFKFSEEDKITQKIETSITNDKVDLSFEIVVESKSAELRKKIITAYLEKLKSVLEGKKCDLGNIKFPSTEKAIDSDANKSTIKISIKDVNNTCTNKGQNDLSFCPPAFSITIAPAVIQPTTSLKNETVGVDPMQAPSASG